MNTLMNKKKRGFENELNNLFSSAPYYNVTMLKHNYYDQFLN